MRRRRRAGTSPFIRRAAASAVATQRRHQPSLCVLLATREHRSRARSRYSQHLQRLPACVPRDPRRLYLIPAAPAAAVAPSCWLVPPDAPIAPTIRPPITSGTPPSTATAPASDRIRQPSPPAASASWNALVGRLNRAAERAFACAMSTLPTCVLSIRSK